jgi:hypothetical protein
MDGQTDGQTDGEINLVWASLTTFLQVNPVWASLTMFLQVNTYLPNYFNVCFSAEAFEILG